MTARQTLGSYGESLAADYLRRCEMIVVERNWRCPRGEIDLVAFDGEFVTAVEVKTRRSLRYGHPFEAITDAKMSRLHTLAVLWARHHGYLASPIRVDAVAVLLDRDQPRIEHLRGLYR